MSEGDPKSLTVQPAEKQPDMLERIMQAAMDPSIDQTRLEAFLKIGRELQLDKAREQFNQAFAELQDDLPEIEKRGIVLNKSGKEQFRYAKYDDLHRAIKPILRKHGFKTSFSSEEPKEGKLTIILELIHKGGFSKFYRWTLPAKGENQYVTNLQNASAAKSFAKRNVLIDALDILTVDSDKDGADAPGPQPITEEQATKLEDMISACEQEERGFTGRFTKWMRAEMQVDKLRDLTQGIQRDAVIIMLKAKMAGLGIK